LIRVVSLSFAVPYGQIQAIAEQVPGKLRGNSAVTKYVTFFTYTSETWARMIQSPGDRTAAVRQLADSVGGSLERVYWMFGAQDGFVIFDAPDSTSAAAVSVAAGSTGAFKKLETHELLSQEQLGEVLSRSKAAVEAYRPPGQQT
jgi:uncharacterized protein with GYD domain